MIKALVFRKCLLGQLRLDFVEGPVDCSTEFHASLGFHPLCGLLRISSALNFERDFEEAQEHFAIGCLGEAIGRVQLLRDGKRYFGT